MIRQNKIIKLVIYIYYIFVNCPSELSNLTIYTTNPPPDTIPIKYPQIHETYRNSHTLKKEAVYTHLLM